MTEPGRRLLDIKKRVLAECFGTFVLVFGGVGSAVLAGSKIGNVGISLAFWRVSRSSEAKRDEALERRISGKPIAGIDSTRTTGVIAGSRVRQRVPASPRAGRR
jgi:hypothetical protein